MVPLHLRVPFVAAVSFTWCIILSVLRGALQQPAAQQVVAAVNEASVVYADDGTRDRGADHAVDSLGSQEQMQCQGREVPLGMGLTAAAVSPAPGM